MATDFFISVVPIICAHYKICLICNKCQKWHEWGFVERRTNEQTNEHSFQAKPAEEECCRTDSLAHGFVFNWTKMFTCTVRNSMSEKKHLTIHCLFIGPNWLEFIFFHFWENINMARIGSWIGWIACIEKKIECIFRGLYFLCHPTDSFEFRVWHTFFEMFSP